MKTFDLIVIGGGRAGGIASSAANKGKKVALIEKSSLGGTCPNRGVFLLNYLLAMRMLSVGYKTQKDILYRLI
jgi:dihydrolipoamide dehydrogenase (EC 1.8.1.4)